MDPYQFEPQINVNKDSVLNFFLSSRLRSLSLQIDQLPHDLTLAPLMKFKRNKNPLLEFIEDQDIYSNLIAESYKYDDLCNRNYILNSEPSVYTSNKYNCMQFNVTDSLNKIRKNNNSDYKISLLNGWNLEGTNLMQNHNQELGKIYNHSNKGDIGSTHLHENLEKLRDSTDLYSKSIRESHREEQEIHTDIHNSKHLVTGYCRVDNNGREIKGPYYKKSNNLKNNLLYEIEELNKSKFCKVSHLQEIMAKSNPDKLTNQKEFYKIHYMGLFEKYNQAKRAYASTLPRMQMLEIQNNILFEIIGKLNPDDEGMTNLLKEFIEMKSFCIHSVMKLRAELGENYQNILDLIINSNSTSEVRPWAKVLSGMFNCYDIKVDDTLIQNLNTLYSINKMSQSN